MFVQISGGGIVILFFRHRSKRLKTVKDLNALYLLRIV